MPLSSLGATGYRLGACYVHPVSYLSSGVREIQDLLAPPALPLWGKCLFCTARIHKNIRHVIDAQKNTPRNRRRVFQKRLLGVYFSQKQGVYLAKNRAYIWPKPTCNLPSLRCRLSPAERALGSRPHMGVPAAAAGCLLPTTKH